MSFSTFIGATLVVGYIAGSIPFGYIIAQINGVDIRRMGSGNIGATNVWRVMGRKWGLPVFLCDLGKGLAAVLIAQWLARHWFVEEAPPHGAIRLEHPQASLAGVAAAVGCILGHNFPVWLRFKGGKGVATSLGVILGMMPLPSLFAFGLWVTIARTTGYVSLASIVASLMLPVAVLLCLVMGWGFVSGWASFYFAVAAALLITVRHRANIQRLLAGTESRFKKDSPANDGGEANV